MTLHLSEQSGTENSCKTLLCWFEFWFATICIDMNIILDLSTTIQQFQRRLNGPTWRIFSTEIQWQGIILAPMGLCYWKMWKWNVKNIFHIGLSEWKSNIVVLPWVPWLRNHLPHMPAHIRQPEQQNIINIMHTWQQCSVTISEDILTTKYGFNLR